MSGSFRVVVLLALVPVCTEAAAQPDEGGAVAAAPGRVEAARSADLAAAEAAFTRVRNGARPEEVAIAEANLRLSQARAQEAEYTYQRISALQEGVSTTRAQIALARRDARVSAAQVDDARARLNLLRAGSRPEDIEEARARRDGAAAWLERARAQLDRCTVRAPVEGTVLRTLVVPGQLVSTTVP